MSYLVLARKYRPSTFAEVVGQEHVTRTLGNAFVQHRVHHGFLFCGPRGCGKTTVARIVGKALNCLNLSAAGEPCDQCAACTSIRDGSATDYQEMDGASNRGIDAIRELTEAVRYQPAHLKKKVYVIDEVHMLTAEAFNALLKTLEEPPPHVTFVLATTEPHKVPNTILSRCQRYDFKLVASSRLATHLASIFERESIAIEPAAVSLVVRESGGSVRDALSLCDQIISYVGEAKITERHVAEVLGVADRTLTHTLVTALASGDAGAALAAVEAATERGVDEVQIARAIVRYLRDLAVVQAAPDRVGQLVDAASDQERADLGAEAAALDRSRVAQMFDRMLRCCDELGKTLQPRLALDFALIDVATIEPLIPLGDLMDRLGNLEARLRTAGAVQTVPGGGHGAGGNSGARSGAVPARSRPDPVVRTRDNPYAVPRDRPPTATGVPGDADGGVRSAGSSAAAPLAASSTAVPPREVAGGSARIAHAERSTPPTGEWAGASAQPTGPVPEPATTAAGSGPQREPTQNAAGLTPTTPAEMLAAWTVVLDALESQRKISLRGYFEFARVLQWLPSKLEFGFAADHDSRWAGENAAEKTNIDELRSVLAGLGHSVAVSVRLLDETESSATAARSLIEARRADTSAARRERESEAREHPVTQYVLRTFGAHIEEINTDV